MKKFLTIIILSLLVFVTASTICEAQEWSRKGKSEIFGILQTMSGDAVKEAGVKLSFDDTTVFGLGIGYNLDNHWNLNTDFLFGSQDVKASGALSAKGDTNLFLWDVNLDYNIMEDRLTPMVSGGIGFVSYDSSDFDVDETDFSYNFGAGLRWDISDNLMLKAMYRITWSEIEDMGDTQFDGVMLSVGYMF